MSSFEGRFPAMSKNGNSNEDAQEVSLSRRCFPQRRQENLSSSLFSGHTRRLQKIVALFLFFSQWNKTIQKSPVLVWYIFQWTVSGTITRQMSKMSRIIITCRLAGAEINFISRLFSVISINPDAHKCIQCKLHETERFSFADNRENGFCQLHNLLLLHPVTATDEKREQRGCAAKFPSCYRFEVFCVNVKALATNWHSSRKRKQFVHSIRGGFEGS